ncbi:MAG: hypothetical protein QXP31_10630 [Pyrobaculum sp.]
MRLFLAALVLSFLAVAYVLPTEVLDTYYWASPSSVQVVGIDGSVLYSLDASYPLIATDAAGRCLAVVNRPYVYHVQQQSLTIQLSAPTTVELSDDILNALRQYGISLPKRIPLTLNFTLQLPPIILTGVYQTAVVSLHMPYGVPLWSTTLRINATAVATNCRDVAVGGIDGRLYVVRDGSIYASFVFSAPVTSLAYTVDGGALYVGTSDGRVLRVVGQSSTQVATCRGSVVWLKAAPSGDPLYACFEKREVPRVFIHGAEVVPGAVVTYGIDTPKIPVAASQNGEWTFVGTFDELLAFYRGQQAWSVKLPSTPLSISASGNGSVVAVGTLGGQLLIFRGGREAARLNLKKPVTSAALSFDGMSIAYETWDSVGSRRLALIGLSVDGPPQCVPAEVSVFIDGAEYRYNAPGDVLVPVGSIVVVPQFKYMGEVRCRPLGNVSLAVTGSGSSVRVGYALEYRVYTSPLVKGSQWSAGPTVYYAEPRLQIPVYNTPGVDRGELRLAGWVVDDRRIDLPTPAVTVNVSKPTRVSALYQVVLPQYIQINATARLRLELVTVFDEYGNAIASGRVPTVTHYPVSAQGYYVPQALVSTRWPASVNGSTSLWADVGSVVVFYAPEYVDLRNGTRLAFVGWSGLEFTPEERLSTLNRTVTSSFAILPKYVVQYRVWVRPPASTVPNVTWAVRGSQVKFVAPTPISQLSAEVREVLGAWVVNGIRINNDTITVRGPLNVTYATKRQYLVKFTSQYGQVPASMWADEGSAVAVVPTPTDVWWPIPPIHWVFAGWRDTSTGVVYNYPQTMPVAVAPTTFEAVWNLDPLPLLPIVGGAVGAVLLIWFIRRRRIRAAVEEMTAP